jgi:hypothetical protein
MPLVLPEIHRNEHKIFLKYVYFAGPLADMQESSSTFWSPPLIFVKVCQLAKKEAVEEVVSVLLGGINSCGQVSTEGR